MPFHVLLLFVLLMANVLLRPFTNALNVLPKILNVIDIPIVGLVFVVYLTTKQGSEPPEWVRTLTRKLFWFCVVLFLGFVLNPSFIYFTAAASQVVMLLLPLLLFIAAINLPIRSTDINSFVKLLRCLIILEVTIGLLQIPLRVKSGDSEAVHGTFPGNAEQYASFLMIAFFYLVGIVISKPEKRKRSIAAIVVILILNLSIDNKASWLGLTCATGLLLWKLGIRARLFQLGALLLLMVIGGVALGYVASKTSNTLYKFEAIIEAVRDGKLKNLGKVKAFLDICHSHLSYPHMLFVGAGPSNFYSRASRQFYLSPRKRENMYVNPHTLEAELQSGSAGRSSDSMGGTLARTMRTPYYDKFYGGTELIYAVGTIQVDSPFSPYAGLLGETGIIGTWLYVGIYLLAARRLMDWISVYREDPLIAPLLFSAFGLMVYMMTNSIYGPFLETTRLTTILWTMVALVSSYVHRDAISRRSLGKEQAGATERNEPAIQFARAAP